MAACSAATADVIFDNTTAYNTNLLTMGNGLEVGNEVTLGSGWYLTNFQFEYYSPNLTLNAALGVEVRFYRNDGPPAGGYPTPGSMFWDSGVFYNTPVGSIPGGTAYDFAYSSADLYTGSLLNLNTGLLGNKLPTDFTFTITFYNTIGNTIQLPLANNSAGTNYGTYWLYNNLSSQWSLLTNSVPANFIVRFEGVPEPTVLGFAAVGGALLLGASKLKRKG